MAKVVVVESNNFDEYLSEIEDTVDSYAYKSYDSPQLSDGDDKDIHTILIPNSGYWWSQMKWWRFRCIDFEGATTISDFRVWLSGSFPAEIAGYADIYVAQGATYEPMSACLSRDSGWAPPVIGGTMESMLTNYTNQDTNYLSVGGTLTSTSQYSSYVCHALRVTAIADLDEITLTGSPYFCFSYTAT